MDRDQRINCTVSTCKYNNHQGQECNLKEIVVEPVLDCETTETDESMCGSYEWEDENQDDE